MHKFLLVMFDNLWTFYLVNSSLNKFKRKYIIFDGIDTIGEIYINEKLIGSTNNMFVKYTFPVDKYLNVGNILFLII